MSVYSEFRIEEPAADVFRLGTGYIGFYLLADGGKYTLVDSGLPGYWDQLLRFLRERGSSVEDIEAQVLTHHHVDHRGLATDLREAGGIDLYIHVDDAEKLTRSVVSPPAPVWKAAVTRYLLHQMRHGVARVGPVAASTTFEDGETLDLPGHPRVVHVPGHTAGHCCVHVAGRRVVLTGDALVGMDLLTGVEGPRIAPEFTNDDSRDALDSLSRLEALDADLLLPVHGPYWEGSVSDAVEHARSVGIY